MSNCELLNSKIICLKYDNEKLKQEIVGIKNNNIELKQILVGIKQENKELIQKIIGIRQEIKESKQEIKELKFDKIKNKIIYALHDLNSYEKLEIKLTQPFNTCFVNIKITINYSNHYIHINDNNDLIENKKKYLLLQLLNLNEDNLKILNKRFCKRNTYYNVIEEVIKYLQNNTKLDIDIDDDNLQIIEFWWDD